MAFDWSIADFRHRAPRAVLSLFFLSLFVVPSFGQALTTAETGQFTGLDRDERLIAGAKAEGTLTVYSSTSVDDMTPLVRAFEERYGIEVEVWRAASSDILQRSLTEARANHNAVDVIETATAEMEALNREGLFQEISSPVFSELMPQAVVPGRPWVGSRIIIYNAAYNTNLVRAADLPHSYEDLLDPKWRGKLGIEATDSNWFMTLSTAMGEENTAALFRNIVATNGFSVRRGHTLLTNMVVSGEVPFALNVYTHEVAEMKRRGAPIEALFLSPSIAQLAGIAVMKAAPHPHAAVLFSDFVLTEGQRIWAEMSRTPTNLRYQDLPEGLELHIVDEMRFIDENQKWEEIYGNVLSAR